MSHEAKLTLTQWTWRSFVTSTLLPLLLVEGVLLGAYAFLSVYNHRASVQTLRDLAYQDARGIAQREAKVIERQLDEIRRDLGLFASQSRLALDEDFRLSPAARDRYALRDDGAYVLVDPPPGGASLFYSALNQVGPAHRAKAHRTARLDPLMRTLVDQNPLVAQVYLNTADSMTRIYPPVDPAGFLPKMDIPTYNFFYLADAAHNPSREVVWTDAYLDPAGVGWVISAVAPVYAGDRLDAVPGIDVTLGQLVDGVSSLDLPWSGYAVLVDPKGNLLALPPAGERDFGIEELTDHTYVGAVERDTPKPDAYDLFKRPRTAELAAHLRAAPAGLAELSLEGERLVSWQRVEGPGWWLVLVVPTEQIYAPAREVRRTALQSGLLLLATVVLFYAVFLVVLYRRARREVSLVTGPISALRDVVRRIREGDTAAASVTAEVAEIDDLAQDVVEMGHTLGAQVRQLEERDDALRAAAEREAAARAASEAQSAFLAHVSHEIRTPMNGVLGNLELIEGDELPSETAEQIKTARSSAQALLTIIDDLLEASRLDSGQLTFEQIPFDVAATVEEVVALFSARAEARGVALRADVDLPRRGALGDPTRLRQVLSNLVSNALKFTDAGSVEVRVRRRDGALYFEVRDTGIGIPKDRLQKIFQAFAQADVSTTRRYGGTGLGLTISAAFVERMGGELTVDSEVGEGSCFSFSAQLPEVGLVPSRVEDAPLEDGPQVCLRVLVAEDNAINQTIVRRMLERLGHEPHVVPDGQAAIEACEARDFDLALLDINMPRLDGRAAARALRARPSTESMPIIALTASVMPEEVRLCREAQMDDVLSKPVTLDQLRVKLAEFAPRAMRKVG